MVCGFARTVRDVGNNQFVHPAKRTKSHWEENKVIELVPPRHFEDHDPFWLFLIKIVESFFKRGKIKKFWEKTNFFSDRGGIRVDFF